MIDPDFRPLISVVRKSRDEAAIEVTLDLDGWIADGAAIVKEGDIVSAACAATCQAVNTLMPQGVELVMSWAQLHPGSAGRRDVVNAAVLVSDEAHGTSEELIGAAFVRSDPCVAAVRATLNGLTRRLGRFTT